MKFETSTTDLFQTASNSISIKVKLDKAFNKSLINSERCYLTIRVFASKWNCFK